MKSLNNKSKIMIALFLSIALIFGIKAAYAYYSNSSSVRILANLVGDFDLGDGDINLMYYKQNESGKYVRTYSVPSYGYSFNSTKTSCTVNTCVKDDSSSSCYYTYDDINKKFELYSDEKVTCKFYFDKSEDADVIVNILKEDAEGSYDYNSNTYSLAENIPPYGYTYVGSTCDSNATATYDSELKKFNVNTTSKNVCYAYFDVDSSTAADIITNVYVQSSAGSEVYDKVETIPANNRYVKAAQSHCYDGNNVDTTAVITYENGYINITNASNKQTCDVYLDLVTE